MSVTTIDSEPTSDVSTTRRVVTAATVGTVVEYFDFAVYGYLSTTLALVFFSQRDSSTALMGTLATLAVAFAVRPIGAIVFGHVGDRWGRRTSLLSTLLVMTGSTVAIGLLPGYSSIGVMATVGLVLLRCIQGMSAGGEIGAAVCFVGEHVEPRRRGFYTGFTQLGVVIGTLFGSAAVAVIAAVASEQATVDWAWRIPFLLAVPMGTIGIYVRLKLEESPDFKRAIASKETPPLPVRGLLQNHRGALLRTIGIATTSVAGYWVVYVYMAVYLQKSLDYSLGVAMGSTTVCLLVSAGAMLLFGKFTDLFGRRRTFNASAIALFVLVWPLIKVMQVGSIPLAIAAHACLGVLAGGLMPVISAAMPESFPTSVRATGMGLGFNIANILAGGTAPYVIAQLTMWFPGIDIPAFYVMFFAVVGLIAAQSLPRTEGLAFREIDRRLSL
ncbi:MFS transporter [Streptomyces sp. NPDC002790]|uniref:MFS transporter n=1 Tax=Streptomyces sp. NPDC002790 TaxID=3154431 RepID=UPI0033290926